MDQFKRIGLISRKGNQAVVETLSALMEFLRGRGSEVIVGSIVFVAG